MLSNEIELALAALAPLLEVVHRLRLNQFTVPVALQLRFLAALEAIVTHDVLLVQFVDLLVGHLDQVLLKVTDRVRFLLDLPTADLDLLLARAADLLGLGDLSQLKGAAHVLCIHESQDACVVVTCFFAVCWQLLLFL